MRHLHRVLLLFPLLLLLCTCSRQDHSPSEACPSAAGSRRDSVPAAARQVSSHLTAAELRILCSDYITSVDTSGSHGSKTLVNGGNCLGYIQGVIDGSDQAMASYDIPQLRAYVPEKATAEELVRVTLRFIDEEPDVPVTDWVILQGEGKNLEKPDWKRLFSKEWYQRSPLAASVVWHAMRAAYPCPLPECDVPVVGSSGSPTGPEAVCQDMKGKFTPPSFCIVTDDR